MVSGLRLLHHNKKLSYLLDSSKSEDDSPFIFLDNSDTEEDGDGKCDNNQDDGDCQEDNLTGAPRSTPLIVSHVVIIHWNPLNIQRSFRFYILTFKCPPPPSPMSLLIWCSWRCWENVVYTMYVLVLPMQRLPGWGPPLDWRNPA